MEKLFPDKIHNKHDPTADSKNYEVLCILYEIFAYLGL